MVTAGGARHKSRAPAGLRVSNRSTPAHPPRRVHNVRCHAQQQASTSPRRSPHSVGTARRWPRRLTGVVALPVRSHRRHSRRAAPLGVAPSDVLRCVGVRRSRRWGRSRDGAAKWGRPDSACCACRTGRAAPAVLGVPAAGKRCSVATGGLEHLCQRVRRRERRPRGGLPGTTRGRPSRAPCAGPRQRAGTGAGRGDRPGARPLTPGRSTLGASRRPGWVRSLRRPSADRALHLPDIDHTPRAATPAGLG